MLISYSVFRISIVNLSIVSCHSDGLGQHGRKKEVAIDDVDVKCRTVHLSIYDAN